MDPYIAVRLLKPDDAPALAGLAREVFSATYGAAFPAGGLQRHLDRAFAPEAVAAELADPAATSFGAWQAGSLTGFGSLSAALWPECVRSGSAVELSRLYVAEAHQGRGAAAELMRAALAAAVQQAHRDIWLYVWEQNPRARAFYRKWGFVQVGEQDLQFEGAVFHDLILQRSLGRQAPARSIPVEPV